MGTQVLSASVADTKPNLVTSTVAFGSVDIGDGELAVWVGSAALPQVEAKNGIGSCVDKLREADWPNTTTGVVTEAIYDVVANLITDTLSEDCVAVIKGSDYTPQGVSCSAMCERLKEVWLETTKVG